MQRPDLRVVSTGDPAGLRLATRGGVRVCLVRPPVLTAPRSLSYYGAVPDLGLAYVAAALRRAGHRVSVVDAAGEALDRVTPFPTELGDLACQGLALDDVVDRIPANAEVIGFAHMFLHEWGLLRELVARARQRFPHAVLIAGGENASAYWDRMLLESPALDACVRGEGEATACALLAALERGDALSTVPGLALREDSRPTATPGAARIGPVDALPQPAWDLFPLERYLERGFGSGVDRGRAMPVLTSRGCPYRCTFCSSPQMWTTRYSRRDPERVVDEIEGYVARYGIRNVNINDLTSLLTKAWILEFCGALERRSVRVTWQLPSGTRSEAVDREAAQAMVAAGCRNFCYAPESGSPQELRRIKKRVKLPELTASLRGAIEAGLKTQASIIIGIPRQEPADLLRTYAFILKMAAAGLHTLSVMVFAPYPGSEEYASLRQRRAIAHDERYMYGSLMRALGSLRSYHERFGAPTLQALQLWFLVSFFGVQYALRPRRALDVAVALLRRRHETPLETLLVAKTRHALRTVARRLASRLGAA